MESKYEKGHSGIGDQVGFSQEIMRVETSMEASEMKRIMLIENAF